MSSVSPSSAPASLLIVDDDPILLQVLPAALSHHLDGVVVETTDSASVALERITHGRYDLVLSDIKMPGMDGWTLLQEIKAVAPQTTVALMSGFADRDLAREAEALGAAELFCKPLDAERLALALKQFLSRQVI